MRRRSSRVEAAPEPVLLSWIGHGPEPGAALEPPVVCVHGLTRNAHDFDALGDALARNGRSVLALDVPGRGRSGRFQDPANYAVPVYAALIAGWLKQLGLSKVDWVGTSMGGMIGMALAAGETPPIRKMVLNDIGPFIPEAALSAIAGYVGKDERFDSIDAVAAHLREIHSPFGPLTDAQWRRMAEHGAAQAEDGWRLGYDPKIAVPFAGMAGGDVDLWQLWDAITVPTLALRGANSTLLLEDTAREMTERGPKADLLTFRNCGHAPALLEPEQIEPVVSFLSE